MTAGGGILVVSGYGKVGARLLTLLEEQHAGQIIVAGRSCPPSPPQNWARRARGWPSS